MRLLDNSHGVSIIAAIFIILILAFMGVMFVSLMGTRASTSVNDMQSMRALYIAEGGLEYALRNGAFCNYNVAAANLGSGGFTVNTQFVGTGGLAAANLNGILGAGVASIPVNPPGTGNYIIPGTIQIDSEYILCTGIAGNQFNGCTRGWAGTTDVLHNNGALVTQCVVTSTGTVATGFLVGNVQRTVQATVGQ